MKNRILHLLEMSPEIYETQVFNNYFLWCNLNSFDENDFQRLLANAVLFSWWHKQYRALEAEFVEEAAQYFGKAEKHVMRQFYTETVIKIKHIYSRPLLKTARNQQPITPQFN